jgi:hypothetical protein
MDILAIFIVLFQFKYFISWFEHVLKCLAVSRILYSEVGTLSNKQG